MCGYIGSELVQHAREIRDRPADLRALVEQDRQRGREAIKAAKRVLADDLSALRILEEAMTVSKSMQKPVIEKCSLCLGTGDVSNMNHLGVLGRTCPRCNGSGRAPAVLEGIVSEGRVREMVEG